MVELKTSASSFVSRIFFRVKTRLLRSPSGTAAGSAGLEKRAWKVWRTKP
jgi:hypothetical protein